MSKQYMIVNGDQILVDAKIIFSAIRQSNGDWEQVEQEINSVLENVQGMVELAESENESRK
jgi:hypothetical protein